MTLSYPATREHIVVNKMLSLHGRSDLKCEEKEAKQGKDRGIMPSNLEWPSPNLSLQVRGTQSGKINNLMTFPR